MNREQLRTAMSELNGERDACFYYDHAEPCLVQKAMLIPHEKDDLVKVSDGKHVYIIDAERVAWIRIG